MKIGVRTSVIIVMCLGCVGADKRMDTTAEVLDNMFRGYDSRIRPVGLSNNGPVVVRVSIFVRNMLLDEENMVCTAELSVRQQWKDDRLKFNSTLVPNVKHLTLKDPHRLWLPDLYFRNEMKGRFHNVVTPNNVVWIDQDGKVTYTTRVSLDILCPMDLRNYPMDDQTFSIITAIYGHTTYELVAFWKDRDPVQVSKTILTPTFSLTSFDSGECTSRTNTGEYSCLVVHLHFSREFTFYLVHAYVPTMSLVVLSWIAFWLHPRATATRLGMCICVLVSLIVVITSFSQREHRVSYIKAMDVWMGTCVAFVFCAIIEMGLVNSAVAKDPGQGFLDEKPAEETLMLNKITGGYDCEFSDSKRPRKYKYLTFRWFNNYSSLAQKIDVVSRILFPVAFVLFNVAYWLTYPQK